MMKLIVKNKYDYIAVKSLFTLYIMPHLEYSEISEVQDGFKILNGGMSIEVEIIPDYETKYQVIESDAALEKLMRIKEILEE